MKNIQRVKTGRIRELLEIGQKNGAERMVSGYFELLAAEIIKLENSTQSPHKDES